MPLTVGRSANDELRDIDRAFNADKINAKSSEYRMLQ